MNIFGVGGAELVLIFVIMLVVAGPKRMIGWAYVIGQYVGKFRILWEQMVDMMQDEVDAAGLDVKLPKDIPTRQNLAQTATQFVKPYAESMEKTFDEVKNPLQESINETNQAMSEAQTASREALKDTNKVVNTAKNDVKKAQKSQSAVVPNPINKQDQSAEKATPTNNFGAWSQPKKQPQAIEGEV